jgi:hypothetical protein
MGSTSYRSHLVSDLFFIAMKEELGAVDGNLYFT